MIAAIVLPTAVALMPATYIERIQSLALLKSGVNAYKDDSLGRRASYIVVGSKMIRHEAARFGSGRGLLETRGERSLFRQLALHGPPLAAGQPTGTVH